MVIDASAIVDLLVGRGDDEISTIIARERLQAPAIVDLEVLSALRRLERRELSEHRATEAAHVFGEMTIRRFDIVPLVPRVWQLRHGMSLYDASYVALAEALRVPLVTRDIRLAKTAGAFVTVITGSVD